MKILSENKVFAGSLKRIQHHSKVTNCEMTFAIFMPSCSKDKAVPVLYWLSGLTCTDENFCQKSGAFQFAEKYGIAIVCPDTSPRGIDIDGQDESYDFGSGAGFYLNATQSPWQQNYQMYDYVTKELPDLITAEFKVSHLKSISGHSMGGHGAIICALKNPAAYQSVSAFAPILNPSKCEWGVKAFTNYLGQDRAAWSDYDATLLLKQNGMSLPMLIDQGLADEYLQTQLMPDEFIQIAKDNHDPLTFRFQSGYDHSYYFITTFIESHLRHHAKALGCLKEE